MNSNIPSRRVLRPTRAGIAPKENENANARPSRISTRTKPVSTLGGATTTTNGNGVPSRSTATTAASRAKINGLAGDVKVDPTAGKRKREALVEVTSLVSNNRPKAFGTTNALKAKDKEVVAAVPQVQPREKFAGVVIKSKPSSITNVLNRPPSRPTLLPHPANQRSTTPKDNPEDRKLPTNDVPPRPEDNAMAVDRHPLGGVRRFSTRRSVAAASSTQSVFAKPEPVFRKKSSQRSVLNAEVDVEESRVFKKRRTSSDAPVPETDDKFLQDSEDAAARVAAELEAYADAEPEADPEGDEWDDLDAEDADDPLMVSEYVADIFGYLKEVEQTTMPNPNYMESQKELAWKMRGILNDWLVQVHVRFRLIPETLFLCVNIIDRFLSARVVSLAKLQLVGVTCLFIAAKYEEIVAPSVSHFLQCADSSYTETEILQAERYILKTLDWNLSYPNPVGYLRRVSKADEYDVKARTVGKYLLEIGCLEWRLIAAPPSLMAAAAIWLARLALGKEVWTPNLAHYSSYSESALVPTANLMLNYVLKPIKHESFYKKYAGKRYYKSSVYIREWALNRWPEGTNVALSEALVPLKARMKLERAMEEEARAAEDGAADGLVPVFNGGEI